MKTIREFLEKEIDLGTTPIEVTLGLTKFGELKITPIAEKIKRKFVALTGNDSITVNTDKEKNLVYSELSPSKEKVLKRNKPINTKLRSKTITKFLKDF